MRESREQLERAMGWREQWYGRVMGRARVVRVVSEQPVE